MRGVLGLALASACWCAALAAGQESPRALGPDQVEIEYVAHACFRIHSPQGQVVMIDPFASRVWIGYDFPRQLTADAVLITHPHYDHDGGRRTGGDVRWMERLHVIDAPGACTVGDVRILGVQGKHADPYGKEFGQLNVIWRIEVADLVLVHLGDNGPLTPEIVAQLGRVDVLMAPIDAEHHILSASELATIRQQLHPRLLVPMHYRLPDLEPVDGKPTKLGPIEPFLEAEKNVSRLPGNRKVLSRSDLPEEEQVLVFRHSPLVLPPGGH